VTKEHRNWEPWKDKSQALQAVRSRALPKPKLNEKNRIYGEMFAGWHFPQCFRVEHQIWAGYQVLAPLGELKPTAQEWCGKGWSPNSKGAQHAICRGKLQRPSKQKWSHTFLWLETKTLSGPILGPTLEPEQRSPLPARPHLEIHDHQLKTCKEQVHNRENLLDPAVAPRGYREWVTVWQHYHQGTVPPTLPEVGQHLDKPLHLVHNYSM
jgi:hypothetical protein